MRGCGEPDELISPWELVKTIAIFPGEGMTGRKWEPSLFARLDFNC